MMQRQPANSYYVDRFLRKFKNCLNGKKDTDLIMDWFMRADWLEQYSESHGLVLKRVCRRLINAHDYGSIIMFMYYTANKPSQYNTAWIKQLLSEIEIRKGYTLAQLVQDFYDTVVDTCPFHTRGENEWYPRIETVCLPFFIFQKVYEEDITAENVSMEKIAAVLRKLGVEEQIKSKWKSDIALIQKDGYEFQNRLLDYQEPYGLKMNVLHIPAFLLPVCQYLEMKKPELCCQILNEYVFPALAQVQWDYETEAVSWQMVDLDSYASVLRSLTNRYMRVYMFGKENGCFNIFNVTYPKEAVETKCKDREIFTEAWYDFSTRYPNIGHALMWILDRERDKIEKNMGEGLYEFLLVLTPCLLFCLDEYEMVRDYFLAHIEDMSLSERTDMRVTVLISQSILHTKDLGSAMRLHGYFMEDVSLFKIDRIILLLKDGLNQLTAIENFLRSSGQKRLPTQEYWSDLLFSSSPFREFTAYIVQCVEGNEVPNIRVLRQWSHYFSDFENPSGVNPSAFGLEPCAYGDNIQLLPYSLRKTCGAYYERIMRIISMWENAWMLDVRKTISIFHQQHISKLQNSTILERVQRLCLLKDQMKDNDPEMEQRIEGLIEGLHRELQLSGEYSAYLRKTIEESQRMFLRKYPALHTMSPLENKIPRGLYKGIMDYLVTAEQVYRCLSGQKDDPAITLDFSPAVLPITKALEQVLHHIFRRMKIPASYTEGLEDQKIFFTERGRPKSRLELAGLITLMKDGRFIRYDPKRDTQPCYEKPYKFSHFKRWGGDSVLDIGLLKQFRDIDIPFIYRVKDRVGQSIDCESSMRFTEDDDTNRMLLALGFDYVREKFRNQIAHKDAVSMMVADECRKVMLSSKYLLWILLAIITEAP